MNQLFDWIHVWLMHRRGYRRFTVEVHGAVKTGWVRATDYDPRFPTVTHRGWTDDGDLVTFHGSPPKWIEPPPWIRRMRDYAAPE